LRCTRGNRTLSVLSVLSVLSALPALSVLSARPPVRPSAYGASATRTGVARSLCVPSPSCPNAFPPQQ
jgi:hypothetical protein